MMRLSRAMIFVKDLDRMADFYSYSLGLQRIDGGRTGNWVEFEAGGIGFALHAIPTDIADTIEIAQPPRAREENPIKLTFEVDDLAAARVRLQSQGAEILDRPWGTCDAIDPEGNVFRSLSPASNRSRQPTRVTIA
jgi:catechol 2,3-dioxygenase-like lactoylglutathione lyase family enzyme